MGYQAVVFDIGGFSVPQAQIAIREYENQLNLPPSFLGNIFFDEDGNKSVTMLERGELLFSEFLLEFGSEVSASAKRDGLDLAGFSSLQLFQKMKVSADYSHDEMFHCIEALRCKKVKTCVLTSNWIDDRVENKKREAKLLAKVRRFADQVINPVREGISKRDPKFFQLVCDRLSVLPKESIFLSSNGKHLKAAGELGLTCVEVVSSVKAVERMETLVGFNLLPIKSQSDICQPPCKPHDVPHTVAVLKSGIKIHYVEAGQGPVVVLLHGFPESWYSWRYQIPALASAGYRVIAIDQRGHGDSSVPYAIEDYTQQKICGDVIDLIDFMGVEQATIVGHDWGGRVAWHLALFYPHRLNGVCGIATPLLTNATLKRLQENSKAFNYQKYFQVPGLAEKEFEEDLARTFKILFRGVEDDQLPFSDGKKIVIDTADVTERGGLLVNFPQQVPIGKLMTQEDLEYYVQQYKKTGFRGGLNWYRNGALDAKWSTKCDTRKIMVPALMITASHDVVLTPDLSLEMEERVADLTRVSLRNCSHWAQVEKPTEINEGLIAWLNKIHSRKSE